MTDMLVRYAVYWAPRPNSPLARFGNGWLGRDPDPAGGEPAFPLGAPPDAWRELVAEPSTYGFHATLKAPFRLAPNRSAADLAAAVAQLAAPLRPIDAVVLHLAELGRFLALVPTSRRREIDLLAGYCVEALDEFRAPPDDAELARRRAAGLTPRQERLLARWGYPFVFPEFRFHMTLTTAMEQPARDRLRDALDKPATEACRVPEDIADLCLFVQRGAGAGFTLAHRFPMKG